MPPGGHAHRGGVQYPHAEILEQAKPILAKQGIDLEIKPFEDYILPNTALAGHDIDANYFQHIPYLNSVLKDHAGDKDYDFVSAGAIHIEPIGIYSKIQIAEGSAGRRQNHHA